MVPKAALWNLNTGAQWLLLPQSYPNHKTSSKIKDDACAEESKKRQGTNVNIKNFAR